MLSPLTLMGVTVPSTYSRVVFLFFVFCHIAFATYVAGLHSCSSFPNSLLFQQVIPGVELGPSSQEHVK